MDELLIGVEKAAQALGIGHSKLYELLAAGEIPSVKVGRRRLVEPKALAEWVSRQSRQQT